MSEFGDKVRSLHFPRGVKAKTRVDEHDFGTVEVTESDERQDVTVKPDPARVRGKVNKET